MKASRPRIVVDARMATDGGIGTYLQELLPRIARARPVWEITAIGNAAKMRSLGWCDIPNVKLANSSAAIFSIREQLELPLRLAGRADLFWAPNYDVPVLAPVPFVVTIHDVNHLALPDLLGGAMRRGYSRWLMASAVHRARRVLFDSEFTRQEARRLLGDSAAKGTVVHLGVDGFWRGPVADSLPAPREHPYLLYVGNIKRHKNVPFLLRAFARICADVPHRLVLIGRTQGLRADPAVTATLEQLGSRAVLLGEVSRERLRSYVAHADAVVTASLYEGFGLPALEAMAAGTPCLVSRAGSLPEICGDAALYADPSDEQSFAAQMLHIARDTALRERLANRGRARAATFSWDRTATLTTAVLEQAFS